MGALQLQRVLCMYAQVVSLHLQLDDLDAADTALAAALADCAMARDGLWTARALHLQAGLRDAQGRATDALCLLGDAALRCLRLPPCICQP